MWIQHCILGGWISKVDWTGLDWQDSTIIKLPRWSSGYHEGQTGRQAGSQALLAGHRSRKCIQFIATRKEIKITYYTIRTQRYLVF